MRNSIFDEIRGIWVEALPEEIVRQKVLSKMVQLGFPRGLICVEKELKQLPHLKGVPFSSEKRRADIICLAENQFFLYPILMVECKAGNITKEAIEQLIGYNHLVKAFFITLAGKEELRTLWFSGKEGKYLSVNFLPSFDQLVSVLKNHGKNL